MTARDVRVIKAVLFDMDDTLLSVNLTAFMARYVSDMSALLGEVASMNPARVAWAMGKGYLAMSDGNRMDSDTNEAVYADCVRRLTRIPVDDPVIADAISYYDREVLPGKNDRLIRAVPQPGAHECVGRVREMGLAAALATNPVFTRDCIATRLRWAGFAMGDFDLVTHMGNSTRLKPQARYYQQTIAALGLVPEECLMVGNDARRDFPRPDIGLATAYVGHGRPGRAVWRGPLAKLAEDIPAVIDRLNTVGR